MQNAVAQHAVVKIFSHRPTYSCKEHIMQALCGKREHALKLRSVGGHMAQGVEGGKSFPAAQADSHQV